MGCSLPYQDDGFDAEAVLRHSGGPAAPELAKGR